MKTSDFDYNLPPERIAQEPAAVRDACKMLVMRRDTGALEDRIFRDIIDYLQPGDLLVANETRVMPARLLGSKRGSGGEAEVFLLREYTQGQTYATALCKDAASSNALAREKSDAEAKALASGSVASKGQALGGARLVRSNQEALWEVLVRPGKRLKPGSEAVVDFKDAQGTVVLSAEIVDWAPSGQRGARLARLFTPLPSLDEALHRAGHTPLPPYIKNYAGDEELYQTVYSRRESSAAAPTAGLHFTPQLIARLEEKGIGWHTVELEVGLDTFRVIDEEDPEEHQIHTEYYTVPEKTVQAVLETKAQNGRVVAVGTTSVRSLESAWDADAGALVARNRQATSLYILPGFRFNVVDALVTNFHVPRSTLMMLVSAFSTRDNIMAAYQHAIEEQYRMLSFGDAMFIV